MERNPNEFDEENELHDCPKCGRTYDDADFDFSICHHCGWDANERKYKPGNRTRSIERYGIDPSVKLDDWDT